MADEAPKGQSPADSLPPAGVPTPPAPGGDEAPSGGDGSRSTESALRAESGRYRTARNASLKREAALRAVLEAHGVDPEEALQRSDISGLTIKDGQVQGEVTYQPPQFPSAATGAVAKPDSAAPSAGLTMDDIRKMDRHQILDNYEEVMKVYRANVVTPRRVAG